MSETLISPVRIGVGIDTARYGHYAAFVAEDRQQAARGFTFPESREGYEQFQTALLRLAQRHGENVHFHIRLDAAGQYAVNLERFLRQLPFSKTISIGEPKRNRDYKNVHFPKRKADPVDSLACARFAIVERPPETHAAPEEFLPLRDLAATLQSQRQQTTRRINQLHAGLARVFPELAALAPDVSAEWVLKLLHQYPTPQRIAAARIESLVKIPYLTRPRARALQAAAVGSTGSLRGPLAEQLVRHLVDEVRHSRHAEETLGGLLEQAFDALPAGGHRQLLTIPGIGRRTAAALIAKIGSLDRFSSPEALVSYFGIFPEENTSGVDKWGQSVPAGSRHMSAKGNDLVRGLLWMACQSAIRFNPPVRALYARQRARGKRGDVALGHCARKMLHLVFAVWKTDRPFDRNRFQEPSVQGSSAQEPQMHGPAGPQVTPAPAPAEPVPAEAAAGRKGQGPDRTAVTADSTPLATRKIPHPATAGKPSSATHSGTPRTNRNPRIDFADLRRQVSMTDVLRRLDLLPHLRGNGPQRRGPCPVHQTATAAAGRTFSVNLVKQVFRCLDPECQAQGNPLDLWAAVHHLPLREAALDLARTFHLNVSRINEQNTPGQLP